MERYEGSHKTREVIRRAASDLERGLENTDCRGRDKPSDSHCPRPSSRKKGE
jgi:hypothetical protein